MILTQENTQNAIAELNDMIIAAELQKLKIINRRPEIMTDLQHHKREKTLKRLDNKIKYYKSFVRSIN